MTEDELYAWLRKTRPDAAEPVPPKLKGLRREALDELDRRQAPNRWGGRNN